MTISSTANTHINRRDLHQQVTDTIIRQLDNGTVPWQQPWKSDSRRLLSMPQNFITQKRYRGINVLLLWSSALEQQFPTSEWATFKQWKAKEESIRKGEKGSMIVYYDTIEKDVDGETKEIPFLKASTVFNRCQLASYVPEEQTQPEDVPLFERLSIVEEFVKSTNAIIEHSGDSACYIPSLDKINMPPPEAFLDVQGCTASEHYYSTLHHELVHWTGNSNRLNRTMGKRFGDASYAAEELVAELGAAFLSASFGLNTVDKGSHASYIEHWKKVLQDNKHCLVAAASEASKAFDYLHGLQPEMNG